MRQLLDFSRANSEDPEVVHLDRLVSQDADLLIHLAGNGIHLRLDFPEESWPVLVSPGKLQTVIFNLVANSRDAMPNGGTLRLQLSNCYANERPPGLSPKDYVALTVSDTGKGMTPGVLARAGEPFFTTKEKGRGTGLGLASAFDLADQCGGGVVVESAAWRRDVRHACTFRARPSRARTLLSPPPSPTPPSMAARRSFSSKDDEPVRRHVGALLRSLNYVVIEATSPQHALAATLASIRIDLIIADIDLVKGAGFRSPAEQAAAGGGHPARCLFRPRWTETIPAAEIVFRKPIRGTAVSQSCSGAARPHPRLDRDGGNAAQADRVRDRIRSPKVRNLYESWRRLATEKGHLPSSGDANDFDSGLADNSYLLEVIGADEAPAFRFRYGWQCADRTAGAAAGRRNSACVRP